MSSKESPFVAHILSLLGGIFILLGAVAGLMFTPFWFGEMMDSRWMGGGGGMMRSDGFVSIFTLGFLLVGVVAGIIVIIGAVMMNLHPEQHMTWGTIVLIFSIVSFIGVGIGGFVIGALLGIAGGALALSWRPRAKNIAR